MSLANRIMVALTREFDVGKSENFGGVEHFCPADERDMLQTIGRALSDYADELGLPPATLRKCLTCSNLVLDTPIAACPHTTDQQKCPRVIPF